MNIVERKRAKRNAITTQHFVDVGILDPESKPLNTSQLKKKILCRALPTLKKETPAEPLAKSQKPEVKAAISPKKKMKEIYEKYFTKIIFNKKKTSGIENKLKVFEHLSSYVKSKSYLQNINKIYNMGQQAE